MPRNLLFASWYSDLGGGETMMLPLVQQLDPSRWRPQLLLPREGQLAERWRAHGWPTHITRWRGANKWFWPPLWARLPGTRRIARILRENDIHAAHSDYHTLPLLLPAATRLGIPTLWTCMGWWFRPRPWQRSFFRQPAHTFAISRAVRDGFLGEPAFMPPQQIEILQIGVDTARFHPRIDGRPLRDELGLPPHAPLVALIARFQDVKGHDIFQELARRVAQALPAARFLVVGDNPQNRAGMRYRERILRKAREDPVLRERMVHTGFRSDVEMIIAASDVIACCSRFESLGMVNIEAMACGRPVVSTRHGGPSETVLDGQTGYLVEPQDVAAFSERTLRLLRDDGLRRRFGAAGRAHVLRNLSHKAAGRQFNRALERSVETMAGAPS